MHIVTAASIVNVWPQVSRINKQLHKYYLVSIVGVFLIWPNILKE